MTTTSAVRLVNERAVFEAVLGGEASVVDVVRATGLSKPTVTGAVAALEGVGLLEGLTRRTGASGRAPRRYRVDGRAGAALGVDVGGSWVRVALVDLGGQQVARREERTRLSPAAALVDQVTGLAAAAVADAGFAPRDIVHTVVGSPGVHDAARDVFALAPNLPGWEESIVVRALRERLPGTLTLENDINLAALAELATGRVGSSFVFVSIGTGLGMGIVLDGALVRGACGAAGEISYLPVDVRFDAAPDAVSCRRGRVESVTAADAVVAHARQAGLVGIDSAEQLFAAARAGDGTARAEVAAQARQLAVAVAGVIAVLDPGVVVLGGGLGRNGDLLLEPLCARLAELVPLRVPQVRVSALGVDAPLLGALSTGLAHAQDVVFTRRAAARVP